MLQEEENDQAERRVKKRRKEPKIKRVKILTVKEMIENMKANKKSLKNFKFKTQMPRSEGKTVNGPNGPKDQFDEKAKIKVTVTTPEGKIRAKKIPENSATRAMCRK